jgi:hypothetical protein
MPPCTHPVIGPARIAARPAPRRAPTRYVPAALLALGLAGCGSGGDDTPAASGTTPPAAATAMISPGNASTVTSRALDLSEALQSSGSAIASQFKQAPSGGARAPLDLAGFATRQLLALTADDTDGGVAAKAFTVSSRACPSGGTAALRLDDVDNSRSITNGDGGAFVFTDCVIDGVTINGGFGFTNLSYTGTSSTPTRALAATFTFDDLRSTGRGSSTAATGDLTVTASLANGTPRVLDMSLSGTRLVVVDDGETNALAGYTARAVVDETAGTYATTLAGAATGPSLPGTVTVSTPSALTGRLGEDPSSGVLLATASDGTSARLTAVSSSTARVDVDGNADGTFETTSTMTWDELRAF